MAYQDDRAALGAKVLQDLFAEEPVQRSTPLANSELDFVSAEVWTRAGLSSQARWLTALTCVAEAANATENERYAYGALQSKALTMAEIREFVLHFAVYCGWSKARAMDQAVTRAAQRLGLAEPEEPPPLVLEPKSERQARGSACWMDVMTFPAPPPAEPYTDAGILNFVFGEMWDRPGLDRKGRRWVTLASVGLCDGLGPIKSHLWAAVNSGDVSLEELGEFILFYAVYAGWPKGSVMLTTARDIAARVADGRTLFD